MTSVSEVLDLVNPSNNSTGVPLNSSISVLFDREIDEWSLEHGGGFILEGPDTDRVIYPGFVQTDLIQGHESEILLTPGYQGLVGGTFSFKRISLTSSSEVSVSDTTGDGGLFRTKAIFHPSQLLKPLTDYKVYLVGDDSDDEDLTGIKSRTVFDVITDPSNTGTGSLTFSGTYLGDLSSDTLNIRITKSGVPGVAEFEAWRDSIPLDLVGPFLTSSTESQVLDGITVQFLEGNYSINDEFSVKVKAPTTLTGTCIFSFTTGNGSITEVPTSTSTLITGSSSSFTTSGLTFEIFKSTPIDGGTNLDPRAASHLIIEFTDNIDPSTINSETVQVHIQPVTDHPLLNPQVPEGLINAILTVSGNKLYIDI